MCLEMVLTSFPAISSGHPFSGVAFTLIYLVYTIVLLPVDSSRSKDFNQQYARGVEVPADSLERGYDDCVCVLRTWPGRQGKANLAG